MVEVAPEEKVDAESGDTCRQDVRLRLWIDVRGWWELLVAHGAVEGYTAGIRRLTKEEGIGLYSTLLPC